MTENSKAVFEFLKSHPNQEFTKYDLVERLDISMSAVVGSVNWMLKNKYATEREEVAKATYKGQQDFVAKYIKITEAGRAYDPDEVERQKKEAQLEATAARKKARMLQKQELARKNSVL